MLRSAYGFGRDEVQKALRKLVGYPALHLEDRTAVLRALDWYEDGLDFADALHLASNGLVDRFSTFDEALIRSAGSLKGAPAVDRA